MFEFISHDRERVPRRDTLPMIISSAAHAIVIGAVAAVPFLYMGVELPQVPQVLAFVATAPPPPPPPPPPPAAPVAKAPTPPRSAPVVRSTARPVPLEPPVEIPTETAGTEAAGEEGEVEGGVEGGVDGGVDGGVPGGIPGGVVGGFLPAAITPPPPPAPPPAPRAPVRVGGAITAPALLRRVAPVYPSIAVHAKVEGVVVLEAVVDREGRVEQVTVLRSITLLDGAATAAVRQWRYSPLLLNGEPERFVVTVTVSFNLDG